MISTQELTRRQQMPLDEKIKMTLERIIEWYDAWDGNVYVAFSGGKDSKVLLKLVRSIYPDVPAVFNNTGLEFPEIVEFVKSHENVKHLRPAKPFYRIIKEHGYPVISKVVAHRLFFLQNPTPNNAVTRNLILTGIKKDGTKSTSKSAVLPKKWHYLIDAPFKIHDICCDILKKAPARKYGKETGRVPFVGTMADDSDARMVNYRKRGCNYFGNDKAVSTPLAFWTEKDIWDYIKKYDVSYCKIYDMGYERTGCMFCMFGVHLEHKQRGTNRFIKMKHTHPKQYKFCMEKLRVGEIMDYIGVPLIEEKQLEIEFN